MDLKATLLEKEVIESDTYIDSDFESFDSFDESKPCTF